MAASFTCPRCRRTSHNINDVREGYCGYCYDWTGLDAGPDAYDLGPPELSPLPTLWPAGRPSWCEGYLAGKPLDDGSEWLIVIPLTFGRARLNVCEPGPAGDASLEHWCLDTPADAIAAWLAWPETPARWNRHQRRDRVLEWPDGTTGVPL